MLPPIFLHGIDKRSGTNFLWRLLLLHPDCHVGSVGEDFFLKHSHLLIKYSERVFTIGRCAGKIGWEDLTLSRNILAKVCTHLSRCHTIFTMTRLKVKTGKLIRKKTGKKTGKKISPAPGWYPRRPVLKILISFLMLFPDAYLIILVRDGRSVVFSGMKSFNWGFEYAAGRWAKSAHEIHEFDLKHKDSGKKYIILKYEDVFVDQRNDTSETLQFSGSGLRQVCF